MTDQWSSCFKDIEEGRGCYSTPSGLFCILCYEENEVLHYERLTRHTIHSLLGEEKILSVAGLTTNPEVLAAKIRKIII